METKKEETVNVVSFKETELDFKQKVTELIKSGWKIYRNITVKGVNIKDMDNYTRISLTLDKKIPQYISNEEGEFIDATGNVLFTSTFAISGLLKTNEDQSWIAPEVIENPSLLRVLLNGSKIDIIQLKFSAGEIITNPFTTKNNIEEIVATTDTYINHIVSFTPGKVGEKAIDRLFDKLIGF